MQLNEWKAIQIIACCGDNVLPQIERVIEIAPSSQSGMDAYCEIGSPGTHTDDPVGSVVCLRRLRGDENVSWAGTNPARRPRISVTTTPGPAVEKPAEAIHEYVRWRRLVGTGLRVR